MTLKRPRAVTLMTAVWIAAAIYGFWAGLYLYGPQDSPNFNVGNPVGRTQLTLSDIWLRMLLEVISFVQLITAREIFVGGSWSMILGLSVPAVVFGIYASFVGLYFGAPTLLGLKSPELIYSLLVGAAFLISAWACSLAPGSRKYLTRWLE